MSLFKKNTAKRELLDSKASLEKAATELEAQEANYKAVREKHLKEINAFKGSLDKEKDDFMADCYLDKSRDMAMNQVVAKFHFPPESESNYLYLFPFQTLSSGSKTEGTPARYCQPQSRHEITLNCQNLAILERMEASLSINNGTIIQFPGICASKGIAAGWIQGLLYAITFFYAKSDHTDDYCVEKSIACAKDLIELHPEFAKDGYENSLIEYLYCYDEEET